MNINGFEVDQYNVHGIREGSSTWTCPECSADRKPEHRKQKCMSVFWDTGLGQCNHCGKSTQLHTYKKKEYQKPKLVKMTPPKTYRIPELKPMQSDYSAKMVAYMTEVRKWTMDAVRSLKIRETVEFMPQVKADRNCIAYDYYENGVYINTKYRDAEKNFKMEKDAKKTLYNIDALKGSKEGMICEGEGEVVTWESAGYVFSTSVPNGFNDKGVINLDYLDEHMDLFDQMDIVYIATDNDPAGKKGRDEIIRRIGAEKCRIIDFGDQKDGNNYAIKYGLEALMKLKDNAKEIKLSGVYSMDDFEEEILNRHKNGQTRGTTTHFTSVDKAWTWREGEVNTWTGYENEGKSLFVNQLALIKAVYDGWKFAVFSPENSPLADFFTDIIEMYVGKSADPIFKSNYMSESEMRNAISVLKNLFYVIYPDEDFKLDTIFEKTEWLVKKHGIRGVIFDPYNTIEHQMERGEREDLYISRFMAKLKRFAVKHGVSFNLVAHQNTARANKDDGGRYHKPDLNNIKGGGTFSAKTDNALVVWRPNRALDFKDPEVIFMSQKIKKQKLVGQPQEIDRIIFDIKKQRYYVNGFNPLDLLDKIRDAPEPSINLDTGEIDNYEPVDHLKTINGTAAFEHQEEKKEENEDEPLYEEPPF